MTQAGLEERIGAVTEQLQMLEVSANVIVILISYYHHQPQMSSSSSNFIIRILIIFALDVVIMIRLKFALLFLDLFLVNDNH